MCFFTVRPPSEVYTLSLHDALPIYRGAGPPEGATRAARAARRRQGLGRARVDVRLARRLGRAGRGAARRRRPDRKSTRLNSSHRTISYAVFCLKKKKKQAPP